MILKEFIKTDVHKNANCVEYVGVDGMELKSDETELLDCSVIDYHNSGGCLEIQLDTL